MDPLGNGNVRKAVGSTFVAVAPCVSGSIQDGVPVEAEASEFQVTLLGFCFEFFWLFGTLSGWWFQRFFIFTPTWGNDPI